MLENHKMRINARFRIAIIDCATSEVLANKYIMVSEKNDLLSETYMLVAGYIQYNNLHNHCGDFEVLLLDTTRSVTHKLIIGSSQLFETYCPLPQSIIDFLIYE